jgi:hypothetical protein
MSKKTKKELEDIENAEKLYEDAISKAYDRAAEHYKNDIQKKYVYAITEIIAELKIPANLEDSFTSMVADTILKDALVFGIQDQRNQVKIAATRVLLSNDYKKLVHDKNFYKRLDDWLEK